jgi:hypothetical protein
MRFPILAEQIHQVRTRDYRRIGLLGNPAYCELHRGDHIKVHIPREPLESTLKGMIDGYLEGEDTKHIYLYSEDGGAGKSHTNRILEEYCRNSDIPYIIWEDDDEDDMDNIPQSIQYLINIAEKDRVVFFRECDAPEGFYASLLSVEGLYIIGHGHEPEEELQEVDDRFSIFDLQNDYAFSHDQIQKLIREYIRELTREPILVIPDKAIEKISQVSKLPGDALNMLGALLAVAAYRAKNGKEVYIGEDDIQNCCSELVVRALSRYRSYES